MMTDKYSFRDRANLQYIGNTMGAFQPLVEPEDSISAFVFKRFPFPTKEAFIDFTPKAFHALNCNRMEERISNELSI